MGFIRKNLTTIIVAMITAMVTAGAPALAHGVQHALFAHNADKVDGKHAVGAAATVNNAAGKLVAHNANGKLPAKFIPKVGDANALDGVDSTAFQRDCQDGAFLASGFVDASAVGATFGTAGLDDVYTCLGTVNVRRDSTGLFSLRFTNVTDGDFFDDIPRGLALTWSATDRVANYFTYAEGGFVLFQVGIVDVSAAGAFADDDFTFMITDIGCAGLFCDPIIISGSGTNQRDNGGAKDQVAKSPRR